MLYDVTYSVWTTDDIDQGETTNHGFESEDNEINNPEELKDLVAEINNNFMHADWCQFPISANDIANGSVSFGGKSDECYVSGDITNRDYHFSSMSLNEAQYLIDNID